MERSIEIGRRGTRGSDGFTLIELMIVVSIIGILATLAVPSYQSSVVKAKEAALRQDLSTLRDVLDQHKADQGKYPLSLAALVSAGYLRGMPKDPFTGSTTTWQEISDPIEGGVVDVFSGAEFVGTSGTPYNRW
ncbi:MAG: prepilin-type N-terminal cleavage/methylation domain-containing protein [Nitrospirota bacterium]|nr:prepilin-type N-terminal cleavage/methylation domain-containing protein [Nitrospirota bacterium]MDP2383489.1 prepilin-type N-terminal cleavage/methylation domain-containing protein [Nitrospirota bacterium]